ncbi:hypothetical protein [Methylobacterium iners]|uniref:Uncharacterized protein n=1 Tax=Methylobacterium iners TaxID=418707 RepID=A0ABQ4S6A0_9HYPH|nr:hypothetical protein [Methylobacterium iners]GJD97652.1 hypothetical protein OCOJLMKI_4885 [Methylobacterium iners]
MADIHILPTRTSRSGDVDHITELLSSALAEGIDLGPRGHHIEALALTLEENLARLREIAVALGRSPVRDQLRLDTVEAEILKLEACVTRLIAMTRVYSS